MVTPSLTQNKLINVLLSDSDTFDNMTKLKIITCTLNFTKDSHRFDNLFSCITSTLVNFQIQIVIWTFSLHCSLSLTRVSYYTAFFTWERTSSNFFDTRENGRIIIYIRKFTDQIFSESFSTFLQLY